MSFRNNLQHLRASRHMTQEQLAMLLGVSRQSVTKWETERTSPDMDKLIQICAIFDCTIDELITGDLTNRPICLCEESRPRVLQDVYGYDELMHNFARKLAVGISTALGSVAIALLLMGLLGEGILPVQDSILVTVLFLGGVATGTAHMIPAFANFSSFKRMHPYIHDFYTEAQKRDAKEEANRALAAGIVLILTGILAPAVMAGTSLESLADGVMVALISIATWLIAYFGILGNRVNIEAYNREASREASEEMILESAMNDERKKALLSARNSHVKADTIRNSIMLLGTMGSLFMLFAPLGMQMPENTLKFFWLPWAASLALCGMVTVFMDAFAKKE